MLKKSAWWRVLLISAVGRERQGDPRAQQPVDFAYLGRSRLVRDPVPENKKDSILGMTPDAVLWPPHPCANVCAYVYKSAYTCVVGTITLTM